MTPLICMCSAPFNRPAFLPWSERRFLVRRWTLFWFRNLFSTRFNVGSSAQMSWALAFLCFPRSSLLRKSFLHIVSPTPVSIVHDKASFGSQVQRSSFEAGVDDKNAKYLNYRGSKARCKLVLVGLACFTQGSLAGYLAKLPRPGVDFKKITDEDALRKHEKNKKEYAKQRR